MKKIMSLLFFTMFSISLFSQTTYNSIPDRSYEYQSPGNLNLINSVLAEKQRNYNNSRKISCNSLIESVKNLADSAPYLPITTSTMLSGVRYYQYQGRGYLIIYVKDDEYDLNDEDDRAYIYCGITKQRWEYFVEYGENTSWGKSFDYYIKNFGCGCR